MTNTLPSKANIASTLPAVAFLAPPAVALVALVVILDGRSPATQTLGVVVGAAVLLCVEIAVWALLRVLRGRP